MHTSQYAHSLATASIHPSMLPCMYTLAIWTFCPSADRHSTQEPGLGVQGQPARSQRIRSGHAASRMRVQPAQSPEHQAPARLAGALWSS